MFSWFTFNVEKCEAISAPYGGLKFYWKIIRIWHDYSTINSVDKTGNTQC